jgi:exopolysaccharide production protein ExoZ
LYFAPERLRMNLVQKRLAYIDGLRGVAIVMVFMIHCGSPALYSLGYYGKLFVYHGRYGVAVFFVVSAYTLSRSMERAFDGEAVSWTAYFTRRFFRIAPLYWVILAFVIWNNGAPYEKVLPSALAHFSFANIFLPQYGNDLIQVEWSIVVEFGFYLLLPVFIFACRRRWGIVALAALFVACYRWQDGILQWLGEPYWSNRNFTLLFHLQPFLIGIFTFLAVKEKLVDFRVKLPLAAVCFYGLYLTLRYGEGAWSEAFISACTAWAIISCESDGVARQPLSWRPLTLVGTISYSIYLIHFIVIKRLALPFQLGPNQIVLVQLVTTIGISSVTFLAIEQPGRRVGAWLVARGRSNIVAARPKAATVGLAPGPGSKQPT